MGKRKIKKNTIKKIIIIGVSTLAVIAAVIAIAIVPKAIINSRFGNIFNTAEDMTAPSILITDLGTDNNYSGASGEILITDQAAKYMIDDLTEVADDFIYEGRENAEGSFDLRYKITDGDDNTIEFYLSEKGMYYIRNGKKYVFVPENSETKTEYKQIYNTACILVK